MTINDGANHLRQTGSFLKRRIIVSKRHGRYLIVYIQQHIFIEIGDVIFQTLFVVSKHVQAPRVENSVYFSIAFLLVGPGNVVFTEGLSGRVRPPTVMRSWSSKGQ